MSRTPRRTLLILSFCALCAFTAARAADVVIFKDGFKLQGKRFKEKQIVPESGGIFQIDAIKGFDIVQDGPKWTIFSSNRKELGASIENVNTGPPPKDYMRNVYRRSGYPLPAFGEIKMPNFDKDWKRKIRVTTEGKNFDIIEQEIAGVSPSRILIDSPTHKWLMAYGTREMPPQQLRAILSTHPELAEKDGKPDVSKRLAIAAFLRDAGWRDAATYELADVKKLVPEGWTKEQNERHEQLTAEFRRADNSAIADELELAVIAGRYVAGEGLLARFDPKLADAAESKRFTELRATVESVQPRFLQTKRLLREVIDELAGAAAFVPHAVAGGGGVVPLAMKASDARTATLVEAGEHVWSELHPDTAGRLELFYNQAQQADVARKANKPTTATSTQLISLAVTGWLLGKNGAEPSPDGALRVWRYRRMMVEYQLETTANRRRAIAKRDLQGEKPPFDVLAQLIANLPPPLPEDAETLQPTAFRPSERVLPGVFRKNTGPLPERAGGVDYALRLPPEYQHGRAYPVVIALSSPGMPPEQVTSLLAAEADRHGYIVAAPQWANDATPKSYDYRGDKHFYVTATLRSLLKHFRVDSDRVFLFGFADGASMALDVGLSHPDLFAGVVPMGANPRYPSVFINSWRNGQKLPVYAICGSMAGLSYDSHRKIYENWMPKGYPSLLTVYRGRSVEWFAAEVPVFFDWMRRKQRVTGIQSLRLGEANVEPWMIMREADNRFYWVGTSSVAKGNLLINNENRSFLAAEIYADIRQGNAIEIRTRGLRNVTIWLDRDMIDWTKPVSVKLNGGSPPGFKPKVIEPDLDVMLETLYARGDRKMLFLNKLEFDAIP